MEAILRQLISTNPAELLIASIWQGVVLTALAWAAIKLAPGLRAATRFTLWLIVFLLVALLPFFAVSHGWLSSYPSGPSRRAAICFLAALECCVGLCPRGCLVACFPTLVRPPGTERHTDEAGPAEFGPGSRRAPGDSTSLDARRKAAR